MAKNAIPQPFQDLTRDYPAVAEAYEALGSAAHDAGPLDERTRRLVKLGIAVGGRLEGAVRAQARFARKAGISNAELDHVILLALTTVGLPSAVSARTWIRDEIGAVRRPAKGRSRAASAPKVRAAGTARGGGRTTQAAGARARKR
ncbi:MAG: carboxymuconolactone decarboxylase family protein [Dehalococcoidia bacterium]